jgi:hypothetical protein
MRMKLKGLVQEPVTCTKHNFTKERKSFKNTCFHLLKLNVRMKSSNCIGRMKLILALNQAANLFQYGNTRNPSIDN